ncbi:LppP/LprE family lipoprotein [Kocuria salsicia]|uniref:LppP/LprE family lipoprotein n=1 Tax=Kocuria salsicia TaxID=664639 RepID=A0ABV3KCM7_9MICC|nr:LppP/LprE family lipoprotein [Kocuria salsicia]
MPRTCHAVVIPTLLVLALGGLTACGSQSAEEPQATSTAARNAPTSGIRSQAPTTTPSTLDGTRPATQPTQQPAAQPSNAPNGADEEATSSATPELSGSCGTDSATKAVDDNLDKVPGVDDPSMWTIDDLGTYDPCAALSWVTLSGGGTGSSIRQQMLFHDGDYLGTTTATPIGFHPATVRLSDSSIQVTYTYNRGNESNAEASGRAVSVYSWNPDTESIDHSGEWPPGIG